MDSSHISRAEAEGLDAIDPLRAVRDRFDIANPHRIYFDGNSLGRPSSSAAPPWPRNIPAGSS